VRATHLIEVRGESATDMGFIGKSAAQSQRVVAAAAGAARSPVIRFTTASTLSVVAIVVLSAGLIWLERIYGMGLRDARYLDGWVLAGGMVLQLHLHVARKTLRMSPRWSSRLQTIHVVWGYFLIVAFLSHTEFSTPETAFEWALWTGFVLVSVSGVIGTYLAWSVKARLQINQRTSYDRIPARRLALAREAHAVVTRADPGAAIALPAPPHESWIRELYETRLDSFFKGHRNFFAHLVGSERPLKQLIEPIDELAACVDRQNQMKLAAIKELVIEKNRLDFAAVHLGLNRAWLLVHVPVTYSLVVLTVLHILVAYAFSSGAW
jgi:hypothetical protein